MPKRILINIGNTHTQVAMAEDGQTRLLEQMDTADIKVLAQLPILEKMPVAWRASAVCVVPMVRELLHKRYGEAITAYGYASFLDLENPKPQYLAAECFAAMGDKDNALSALAALETYCPKGTELGREYLAKAAELKADLEK